MKVIIIVFTAVLLATPVCADWLKDLGDALEAGKEVYDAVEEAKEGGGDSEGEVKVEFESLPYAPYETYTYKVVTTYDKQGNMISKEYFTPEGESAYYNGGIHKVWYTYDKDGNLANQSFWDENEEPSTDMVMTHKIVYSYYDNGTEKSRTYYKIDGSKN